MMTAPVGQAAAANPLLSSLVMDLELAGFGHPELGRRADCLRPHGRRFRRCGRADPEGWRR